MIALALIHGGTKPSFFSERLYTEISGQDTSDVTLEEVDDWDVKGKLQRVFSIKFYHLLAVSSLMCKPAYPCTS